MASASSHCFLGESYTLSPSIPPMAVGEMWPRAVPGPQQDGGAPLNPGLSSGQAKHGPLHSPCFTIRCCHYRKGAQLVVVLCILFYCLFTSVHTCSQTRVHTHAHPLDKLTSAIGIFVPWRSFQTLTETPLSPAHTLMCTQL